MKTVLTFLALAVGAVPVAAIVTLLLVPFWRWLEARTGIESIGHSGPADWCFVAVYGLVLVAGLSAWWRARRRSRS